MLHLLKIVTCLLLIQDLYVVDAIATTQPTGYNNAKTVGDCLGTFTGEVDAGMTCAHLTPYLKCLIRVTKLYAISTDEDSQELEQTIKDSLSTLNIKCDFKLASLIEEVRREQSGDNGSKPQQGYNNAKTVEDCLATFTGEIDDEATCARLTPYLKCLIRVTNAYASITNEEKQRLEQTINDGLNKLNIKCDFKLASLIEEVRREQSGDNGSKPQQGNGENGSNPQQRNGKNGADMVVGSFRFVTVFILTCASVFVLL